VAPVEIGGFVADWIGPCQRMVSLERERPRDHDALRALLETDFRAFQIKNRDLEEGLFTGYYEPLLRGSRRRRAPYDVPLYKLPRDLITIDLGRFREELRGQRLAGRVEGRELLPYAERRAIEGGALARRDLELLWVDDPIDAFFLQIQGSGQIELPDGRRLRLGYAGQNGHPYFAIGRELIARGALTREQVSLQSIRAWLQENPEQATEVMALNASYVFFRELEGEGPIGSHGVVLTPGRSLAIDRSFLPLGAPLWLDTTFPTPERVPTTVMTSSAGATATEPSPHSVDPAQPASAPLQRLVVAQDTGGAIRGPVRGDLFWGAGEEAEELAGHMKQQGRLYLLLPIALAERVLGDRHASGPAPARQKELASASVGNVGRRSVRR
jgi:membrane-bound lytic murein transglycosylase A